MVNQRVVDHISWQIEPWCGSYINAGPTAVHKTFVDVNRYWQVEEFDIYTIFNDSTSDPSTTWSPSPSKSSSDGGNVPGSVNVAVFGRFRYRSRTLGQVTDSPFCVWAKVDEKRGKVTYMQFMEDTLDSARSFRKSGKMVYVSDPDGTKEVVIGSD